MSLIDFLKNLNPNFKNVDIEKTWKLRPITYIGMFLSNVALLTTAITYKIFKYISCLLNPNWSNLNRRLRRRFLRTLRHGMVHKSLILLAVALLLTNTVFILNSLIKPERNLNLCIFSAILFHYLILATFMSMLVLSVAQYLAFVKIFTYCVKYFTLKSILFAFGKYSFWLTLSSLI